MTAKNGDDAWKVDVKLNLRGWVAPVTANTMHKESEKMCVHGLESMLIPNNKDGLIPIIK
jgi:hypothetical protein